jgi:XRE family transcriptional regulator, regulator of sulfur utilization
MFGNRVRELRVKREWSQETLAERSALSVPYISDVERGRRNVGLDNILRLAHAFRVKPEKLFRGVH